jgi:hypothetical protein
MKLNEFKMKLEEKEKNLRSIIDSHQTSLLKFKIEEQHIMGEKEDCEECKAVNQAYKEILDFEIEILGFSRIQSNMSNMIKLIEKIIEMREEENDI